jgi:hypothetical protein
MEEQVPDGHHPVTRFCERSQLGGVDHRERHWFLQEQVAICLQDLQSDRMVSGGIDSYDRGFHPAIRQHLFQRSGEPGLWCHRPGSGVPVRIELANPPEVDVRESRHRFAEGESPRSGADKSDPNRGHGRRLIPYLTML